jgi:hypothetical protein
MILLLAGNQKNICNYFPVLKQFSIALILYIQSFKKNKKNFANHLFTLFI